MIRKGECYLFLQKSPNPPALSRHVLPIVTNNEKRDLNSSYKYLSLLYYYLLFITPILLAKEQILLPISAMDEKNACCIAFFHS